MIRFIVERHAHDATSGLSKKDFITYDFDVPELEELLQRGGMGEFGFLSYCLRGCEVIDGDEE